MRLSYQGFSIRVVITLVAVTLVVASGGLVLAFVYKTSNEVTTELIREKAEIVNRSIVQRIRSHLLPVEAQANFVADLIRQEDVATLGSEVVGGQLYTALAASPQVSSLSLVDDHNRLIRAFRNRPFTSVLVSDWSDDPDFVEMMFRARRSADPHWGPLFYAESSDATFLNYITPVADEVGQSYTLLTSVSLAALSRFLRSLQGEIAGTPFILSGEKSVLAHALLSDGYSGLNDSKPLPDLADFSDPILRHLWSPNRLDHIEAELTNGLEARVVKVEDVDYVFLLQRHEGFGETPWIIGSYFTLESVASGLTRNREVAALGAAVILVAVLLALLLSRMISRPIRRLARTADCINNFELDVCTTPRRSLFKEINEANAALASAIRGLTSLKIYLPQGLARKLVQNHDGADLVPEERLISVLFTDIVGFTAMAEARAPKTVLALLNEHFTLISDCIREEGGIVDKFIGDSAMAFWGGIESDQDHAVHACRAAVRIMEAIEADNARRRAEGLQPIHLCIGVHSGSAMVGNIGSAGRLNYTVIGDTVNTAERLEVLGRDVRRPDSDAVCLISGDTAMRVEGEAFTVSPVGRKVLHGRHDETDVYRLVGRKAERQQQPKPPAGKTAAE